jgi:IgA Peptidase M64
MTTADGSVLGTTQISGSAPRNRAFNVVLLAEGFTNSQQNDFNNSCTTFVNDFQITPPFNGLGSSINVFRVNVSSTDSGADDPAVDGGAGTTAQTYFDASFGGNNIRRLLVCNISTALQVAAAQVPEFSVVLVVVNSTIYGGSGGSVGTYSLAGGATEIAIHEMGHTAFGLADEYAYYAGGTETGHDRHPALEPSEPNVTVNIDRNILKWQWAVAKTTALPTMSNPNCSQVDTRPSPVVTGTVGLFEGAHYYHCGAYRPEYTCKMRSLGVPFCRVCRQIILNRIRSLNWTFAGNTAGFGHGINDGRPFWIGNFSRADRTQVLFYYPGDDNWWLGSHDGNQLNWTFAGNTAGFGHGINDGRPFWIGDFNGDGRADILFYYPGDDNWWLGSHDGNQLQWTFAGNTAGFGNGINDGRPFWIGNFSRADQTQILFYYPGDDNWWLGSYDGNQLQWTFAGNTAGFGHGINDARPFWIGDFNGDGRADILFYYPGDDNWWLGSHDGNQLQWTFAGNTAGFGHGINDGRPFWIGNFSRTDQSQVLFYYPGDDNWWLSSYDGNQLNWKLVGNTAGFGHGINDGRPFWIGDFNGDGRADILFYYPGDDNWWLGSYDGSQLNWKLVGNTAGFGHGINDGRPFWIGDFSRTDQSQALFYYPGDDNWWLGSIE